MNNFRIKLENKNIVVEVAPACGGSITRFDYKYNNINIPIFRRCDDDLINQFSALGASCFPLLPYSNRLRHGEFMVERKSYHHKLNCLPEIHSSHGDAWMRPWGIINASDDHIEMHLQAKDDQPIKYAATQIIQLEKDAISIRIKITNKDLILAPFGIGIHPYFPRTPDSQLMCDLASEWTLDNDLMPVQLVPNPIKEQMKNGILVDKLPTEGAFNSSSTDAYISLQSNQFFVKMETKPKMQHAILWCPAGQSFFCYEPVSHMIDGFNMSNSGCDNTGVKYIPPNASYEATWKFKYAKMYSSTRF
jgi:aldose 1-epimerase